MSTKKPISEIKAELYEVLADKTLSFGCKVTFNPNDDYVEKYQVFFVEFNGTYHCRSLDDEDRTRTAEEYEITIIGHEPTLNDVLLKMFDIFDITPKQGIVTLILRLQRRVCCQTRCGKNTIMAAMWILENYKQRLSFDNQSEETLRKLHELICKKYTK